MKTALVLALAAACWAGVDFDGARRGSRLPRPSGAVPPIGPARAMATPVAPDLAAARARLGNEAELSRLAAAPGSADRVSLAVIGDSEPGRFFWERWFNSDRRAFEKNLAAARAGGAEFTVQLGDFVSRGVEANFRKGVAFLDAHPGTPVLHVQGNHDRSQPNGPADKDLFRAVFGPGDYFLDRGGWRFVVLDSADYAVTDAQLDWLERALDTDLPALLFLHVPPATLSGKLRSQGPGQEAIDREAKRQWDAGGPHAEFLQAYFDSGSARFGEIVARRKVRRVYLGHIHAFGTAEVDGVRYVLSGCGGSPHYPLPPGYPTRKKDHYIRLEAGPGGTLSETVHELDGTTFPIAW